MWGKVASSVGDPLVDVGQWRNRVLEAQAQFVQHGLDRGELRGELRFRELRQQVLEALGQNAFVLLLQPQHRVGAEAAQILAQGLLVGVDADDLAALGAVNVIATDSDGDQVAGTVDISVSDDVPSITALPPGAGLLTVDESNLAINATANFAALFNVAMGADQPGSASYSFVVSNGSGLVDVATGSPITLHAIGNVVEGRVAGSPGIVAFRLTVTPDGQATLDQIRAVRHADATNPDDALSIPAPFIQLTATVTDSDGDQASATVNVGGTLVFRDDGPSLDVTAADADTPVMTVSISSAPSTCSPFGA
ncbi:MAG: hypothetical protein HC863_03190 [Myxococcales bacterium]|nr:hypothetical protein [Myxococcales bacterium]